MSKIRHSSNLPSPAQCLYHALVPAPKRPIQPSHLALARRPLSSTPRRYAARRISNKRVAGLNLSITNDTETSQKRMTYDPLSELTKDNAIPFATIQLVGEAKKLSQPEPLQAVLRRLNRLTSHLVLLAPPSNPGAPAVCGIFAKDELLKRKAEKREAQKQQRKSMRERQPKQLELNWAIGSHDLELKLGQLAGFLEKGRTVEMILAAKKKTRRATLEEAETVLKNIRERMMDMGAKEVKPTEGQVLKQLILTVALKNRPTSATAVEENSAADNQAVPGKDRTLQEASSERAEEAQNVTN